MNGIRVRAYHVGVNGGKLPPLGPRGEFSLNWGGLLVICNVWAVLIFCAKTRNHGRRDVMSR